jgi:hypothetical protein
MRRECSRYWEGQYAWQRWEYESLQACVEAETAMTCPPQYSYGPLQGVREDRPA